MKRIIALGVLFGLLLSGTCFAQPDRSAEVQKLLAEIESSSQTQRINAAKVISRSGLRDQGLYQKIAEILSAGYGQDYGTDHIDEMAWLCKALAASGDLQYRTLLDEVAQNSPSVKLQKYARQSSELIEQYAQRSQVLNATDSWDEQLSAEDNRLVNMLNSTDVALKRDAAKIIVRTVTNDKKVFAAVASTLKAMVDESSYDSLSVDTMAWLCKALAASGDARYLEALEFVRNNTSNSKLWTHAGKAIKALNSSAAKRE